MRCRFCHKAGHNRNSCPEVASNAIAAKQAISEGMHEHELNWKYRFALQVERNKAIISANAVARGTSNNPRKCSYCSETGHTRAKCATLNHDRTTFTNFETRFRNAFSIWLANSGIGIGAMIERVTEWEDSRHVTMFTKCNNDFANVGLLNTIADRSVAGTYLNRDGWENYIQDFPIPSGTGYPFADGSYGYKVIAPAPIPFEVGENYLKPESIKAFVDTLFDEKPKREYRWHKHKGNWGSFHTTRPNLANYLGLVEQMENAANSAALNAA
jgi:hypothetical protein